MPFLHIKGPDNTHDAVELEHAQVLSHRSFLALVLSFEFCLWIMLADRSLCAVFLNHNKILLKLSRNTPTQFLLIVSSAGFHC